MSVCVLMQNARFQRTTTSSWLMGWTRPSSTSLIMETPSRPSSQRSLPSSPPGLNWWSLSGLIYWWGRWKFLLRLQHTCVWCLKYSWGVTQQVIGICAIWKADFPGQRFVSDLRSQFAWVEFYLYICIFCINIRFGLIFTFWWGFSAKWLLWHFL